jgi:hypothetical protein
MTRDQVKRLLLKALYWLAVLIASIAILIAVILILESRDESSVNSSQAPSPPAQPN